MIFNYLGEWVSIHYDDRIAWVGIGLWIGKGLIPRFFCLFLIIVCFVLVAG